MVICWEKVMSFLKFCQTAGKSPISDKFTRPTQYCLFANIVFEHYQPNWLTKGAIRMHFGRVALPSDFADLSCEQQLEVAKNLAKKHYEEYAQQIPYEGRIVNYFLKQDEKKSEKIFQNDFE